MARAIAIISGSAPFSGLGRVFSGLWRELTRDAIRPYRPELHYMRGPGPAWRALHGEPPAA